MKVFFYAAPESRFDRAISKAFCRGVTHCGDKAKVRDIHESAADEPTADVAVLVGVKGHSKACFESYVRAGRRAILIDKGYTRISGGELGTLYFRMAIDAFQPCDYMMRRDVPTDRWDRLNIRVSAPRTKASGQVLFCGSSQKYCDWHQLGSATDYATAVLGDLSAHTQRDIVYRPKPTWKDAVPISPYRYSHGTSFPDELRKTFAVVTFGSNAAFEALLHGIPAVVLGDGVARPLARTSVDQIENPLYPSAAEVYKLACAVAYCQWSLAEMERGEAWVHLRSVMEDW